jgi:hypothetical protein
MPDDLELGFDKGSPERYGYRKILIRWIISGTFIWIPDGPE